MIPTTSSSLPLVVERETEATKDPMHPTNNRSTKDIQPSVVQTESLILNSEPVVAPIIKPVAAPVSALKPNQRPLIPYPSRLHDQKLRDKAINQREKFFQIFKDLNFNISFAYALILMPKNLFPPLDNPELKIQRRSHADPTLLNDFEMAAEGNGDLPVPDLRTMEELSAEGNGDLPGGPIASIAIQAMNFELKNDMIQQVQNPFQFHGLSGDDANKHLDKFLHVTQSIKVNGVTDDALRLYLFPHSLTHHATTWFDRLPRNSINTFVQMAKMFLAWEHNKLSIDQCPNHNMFPITQIDTFYNGLTLRHRDTINAVAGGSFMKRRLEECYDLIENMTAHHNDWDTLSQQSESSSSITSSSDTEITALKAEMAEINKNLMRVLQVNQQVKAITPNYETYGGPYSFNDYPPTVGNTQNVYAVGAYQVNSYHP
nr:hypothetical protein [Tanacetum cinerariifolium]